MKYGKRGDMPRHAARTYAPIFERVTARYSEKSKVQKYTQMKQCYALDFFYETRSVTVPLLDFFPSAHG